MRGPLLRVDPRTGRVRARIALGGVLGFGVRAMPGGAWVWGPSDLLRIDGRAGRVARRIAVGPEHGELSGLAVDRRRLLAGTADGHLLRFDPRTGRRMGRTDLGLPDPALRGLAGDRLVFTTAGIVGAFDLDADRIAWLRRLGYRAGATLGDHGVVWAHSAAMHDTGDRVSALCLDTGRVAWSRRLPSFSTTGIAAAAGRVAIPTAGGALFVVPARTHCSAST